MTIHIKHWKKAGINNFNTGFFVIILNGILNTLKEVSILRQESLHGKFVR